MIISSIQSIDNLFGDLNKNYILSICCKHSGTIYINTGWSQANRTGFRYYFKSLAVKDGIKANNYIKRKNHGKKRFN